ncbi:neutral/alkaline ceramidase-like enzyme [Anaerobacterium chartisolvens]|uniref:Neutral/alkaline ceramidase-like enzyme n=1 Tax=Anaerobacterium chartisolvens TaxID=1297424 RepID=A0A369AJL3_9FIRM|nr:neutral/alkaline non-lysosomal ceramidase N-terminal domain-containing protein [Anaerobacterium chartisolvens]RCX09351.1 neutral/alkaline ceramidase-like enzyme [Anaerobacterium chartisolvens]
MKKVLKAGVGSVDISPGESIELGGYPHYLRHNTGIHDPLYASCIYLESGGQRLIMIAMDILFYSKKYVSSVRKRIRERTGVNEENIMICCSHTHSGPWASGRLDLEALEMGLRPDEGYVEELGGKLVELASDCAANTFEAKIAIEKGRCGKEQGVGGNRRNPEGPCDPLVWTIGVQDMDGSWRGCLVRYALHPTVIHAESTVVTADYPCYIREYLARTKPGMVFAFAQGTSGDQSTRYFRKGQSFDEAERIGSLIGAEVDRVLNSMQLSSEVDISVKSRQIEVKLRTLPSREEAERSVEAAKKALDEVIARKGPYLEEQNASLVLLGAEDLLGYVLMKEKGERIDLLEDELPAEIQVISIGDARIVCVPGEIFVEFGLEIAEKSLKTKTFVIELANGCLPGYVCTEKAFYEGGYEADTSLLTPETGRIFVDTALSLLE